MMADLYLCGAVNKIPRFSEMSSLQTIVLPVFPDRYQFSREECHHINRVFLCGRAEEDPAYMCRNAEVHFISMLTLGFLDYRAIYHCFRQVVSYESSPNFLHDKLWLIGMEVA